APRRAPPLPSRASHPALLGPASGRRPRPRGHDSTGAVSRAGARGGPAVGKQQGIVMDTGGRAAHTGSARWSDPRAGGGRRLPGTASPEAGGGRMASSEGHTTLYVMRHAESAGNVQAALRPLVIPPCAAGTDLTPLGEQQALAAAQAFGRVQIAAI